MTILSKKPLLRKYTHMLKRSQTLLLHTTYPSWVLVVVLTVFSAGILIAVLGDGHLATQVAPPTPPDRADLDVLFIERNPKYAYDGSAPPAGETRWVQDPDGDGWPEPGEQATFIVHVKNNGSQPTGVWNYRFFIDNISVVYSSYPNLAPGERTTFPFSWTWQDGIHTVRFVADVDNFVTEITETNNQIEDRTNALGVAFWVEQSIYDWFHQNQYSLCSSLGCAGSNSYEDWVQRRMREWNRVFSVSAYPQYPFSAQGVLDRVRLEKVMVVPDGWLPYCGDTGVPSPCGRIAGNHPDITDKTIDMMWGYPSGGLISPNASDRAATIAWLTAIAEYDGAVVHEMGHARYLIDVYNLDVAVRQVHVRDESGNLIAGTPAMPIILHDVVYFNKADQTVVAGGYDVHSVGALNRIAGLRSRGGNSNAPTNYGEYLDDLPQNNFLKILALGGAPLTGARVRIFQSTPVPDYDHEFDNIPDIVGFTDASGVLSLGPKPRPFFTGGLPLRQWLRTTGVVLVEIKFSGVTEYRFVDITDFNIAYWLGNTTSYTHTIQTNLTPLPCSRVAPTLTITPPFIYSNPGTTETFTVSVRNNDSLGCDLSPFSVISFAPVFPSAGWTTSFENPITIDIPPGQTRTMSLSVTSPSIAGDRIYPVVVRTGNQLDTRFFSPQFLAAQYRIFSGCTGASTDSDGDGIIDCVEQRIGTNPLVWDTDKDGCSDGRELGPDEKTGGLRDPTNPYDYYDINHDGAISVSADILQVVSAFGVGDPEYHPAKDRGSLKATATTFSWDKIWGLQPFVMQTSPFSIFFSWEKTPPNGSIDIPSDGLGVATQFGHACPHNHALYTGPSGTPFGPHPVLLTSAVPLEQTAPFAISVNILGSGVPSPAANFPASGKLLIRRETLSYDQMSGLCPGFNPATQFCITARGNNVPVGNNPIQLPVGATVFWCNWSGSGCIL